MESNNSGNINSLWLANIFENLKKIEIFERYAREGCESVIEYAGIPFNQRHLQIADIQFKNLKCLLNEFLLVVPDLSPVLKEDDLKEILEKIKHAQKAVRNRDLFINEPKALGIVKYTETTSFFDETLDYLSNQRLKMINKIAHLLYIKDKDEKKEDKRFT